MRKKLLLAKQGEIWLVEFPPSKEARKPIRPVLIISGNVDRERLKEHLGKVSREIMEQAKTAWKVAFDAEEW